MNDGPDVLVLGAGGALGERWMHGVLAGLAHGAGIDFRRCEHLVGTSAGAIVAASLLAGRAPERPEAGTAPALPTAAGDKMTGGGPSAGDAVDAGATGAGAASTGAAGGGGEAAGEGDAEAGGSEAAGEGGTEAGGGRRGLPARARGVLGVVPRGAARVARAAGTPLAPYALAATRPPGALLRANVLGRIERPGATLDELGRRIARDKLRFDGRLRVVCVERESGRRVVFGSPGAPSATVAEAVQASCAVPWLYRPVRIGDREYVDGGLWSPTSIDVAPAGRETRVLCLNPTGSAAGDAAPHGVIRATSRSAAALEALTLRRRGAEVTIVAPDRPAAAVLAAPPGDDDHAAHAFAAGFRQGLALASAS
ncbi:patatin-like phospholipase family protein [Conexibacter arvalis]|uniref:NTE family protein n=1 Tax=Conexibacter arvalis TaxID=912552 RepID=A0A840IIB3_9ACTN|nr:NTE family protein [Conexibacter arvalis]